MEVNGVRWCSVTDVLQNIFRRKRVKQVCNVTRASKWWKNCHILVNCPFNSLPLRSCSYKKLIWNNSTCFYRFECDKEVSCLNVNAYAVCFRQTGVWAGLRRNTDRKLRDIDVLVDFSFHDSFAWRQHVSNHTLAITSAYSARPSQRMRGQIGNEPGLKTSAEGRLGKKGNSGQARQAKHGPHNPNKPVFQWLPWQQRGWYIYNDMML